MPKPPGRAKPDTPLYWALDHLETQGFTLAVAPSWTLAVLPPGTPARLALGDLRALLRRHAPDWLSLGVRYGQEMQVHNGARWERRLAVYRDQALALTVSDFW